MKRHMREANKTRADQALSRLLRGPRYSPEASTAERMRYNELRNHSNPHVPDFTATQPPAVVGNVHCNDVFVTEDAEEVCLHW